MEFDGGGRPMKFDGGGGVQLPAPLAVTEASASAPLATSLDEESMWQMNLRVGDSIDPGPYPERPGEPDCSYYLRTGLCRFGITCRFNHPPNRKLSQFQHQRIGTAKPTATEVVVPTQPATQVGGGQST